MTITREKEERGRLLLIFSGAACARKHLHGFRDGESRICLEKEILGIQEDEEFSLVWENGAYWIQNEELSEKRAYYYFTRQKERLLLLLSGEQAELKEGEKLILQTGERCRIGNAYQNQIFYDCYSLIEAQMAEILREKEGYVLCPAKAEGIYVNERAVKEESRLCDGDRIDVYGLHILVLRDILFCCSFTGIIRIARGKSSCKELAPTRGRLIAGNRERGENKWIERYRTQEESLHAGEEEILLPETVRREKSVPLFLNLGPSVTMVFPMLLMAWIGSRLSRQTGTGFYLLSVVMGISTAFLAFFWGVVNHGYRKQMRKQGEKERNLQYREYLEKMREYLQRCEQENRRILEQRYPPAATFLGGQKGAALVAWDRYYRQPDFLFLRMGVGKMDFQINVKLSGGAKRIVPDKLSQMAVEMVREFQVLENVPDGVDFFKVRQLGILGEIGDRKTREILFQLLIQLAACHCYTEVKLVCFYRKEILSHRKLAEGIKWLQHSWSSDGKLRFLAGDEREAARIIPVLQQALEKGAEEEKPVLPWYLVLIFCEELIQGEVLYRYLTDPDEKYPVSTIFIQKRREELPKSCRYYLKVQGEVQELIVYGEEQLGRKPIALEGISEAEAQSYFREISGFRVKDTDTQMQLPEKVDFLQLFGCKKLEELACAARWKKNNPGERLKVPIGVGMGEKLVWLDVHEKFHGPHGLIAGTTGSGKSELLQTYLLSLSVNYSPEDVNFFMIDYKGGGTGNQLQKLPHCAGIISNLSGKQIKRAMSAIISENKRRQQLLKSAGSNHIDAYTQLYKEGRANEPMPHLLLVVDEFAELRREEPEFMQDIVSLAQVGRSLGVHLILATQKPAGTVDDRIWSNARFRLCLRVQDKQDSMDVLHNKDAAMLTVPGQCFLQIGNQEYYELFQTGYCGEVYRDAAGKSSGAALVEATGVRWQIRKQQEQRKKQSQLEAVIDYVNQIAEQTGYGRAEALWMPELPDRIDLDELRKKMGKASYVPEKTWVEREKSRGREKICLQLGICDDPENQRQLCLEYEPEKQGHLAVCGGPATGKTALLHTILWQLCTEYTPDEAVVLAVDIGQGSMGSFQAMPGCIGIWKRAEEREIFFYHLKRFVAERKELLSGISAEQYNKMERDSLPYVFLVIDNFGAFFMALNEKQQEFLLRLAAEGIHCGVYLILASAAPGEIPGKLYEKIKTSLALEMSDRFAYGDILRQYHIPVLPKENTKGRGLCKIDGRILEFQAVLAISVQEEFGGSRKIEQAGQALRIKWEEACRSGKEKRKVRCFPQIPEAPDYETLKAASSGEKELIPLGYSLRSGEIVPFKMGESPCFLVSGEARLGRDAVLFHIAEGLLERKKKVILIDQERRIANLGKSDGVRFGSGEEEILQLHRCLGKESCILIENVSSFCSLIYRADELRQERIAFWESLAQGKEKNFFLVGGCVPTRDYETEATAFFRELAKWQTGIHLGGKGGEQRIFSFEDLGYAVMNQYEPVGIGYYKNGPGSRTERILVPIGKEVSDDSGGYSGSCAGPDL